MPLVLPGVEVMPALLTLPTVPPDAPLEMRESSSAWLGRVSAVTSAGTPSGEVGCGRAASEWP